MFVRTVSLKGARYLQLTVSFRKDGVSRHRVLMSFGRYEDSAKEWEIKEIIRDYKPLSRAQVVIDEVQQADGPIQGKGYFVKFRGWT